MLTLDNTINGKVQMLQTQVAMLTTLVSSLQSQVKKLLESPMNTRAGDQESGEHRAGEEYESDEELFMHRSSKVQPRLPQSDFVWIHDHHQPGDNREDGQDEEEGYETD